MEQREKTSSGEDGLMVGSSFSKGSREGPSEELGELRPECRCGGCVEIRDSCLSRGTGKRTASEIKTGRSVGPTQPNRTQAVKQSGGTRSSCRWSGIDRFTGRN